MTVYRSRVEAALADAERFGVDGVPALIAGSGGAV